MDNDPFSRAQDDDLARATIQPAQADRETFGMVPPERATVKFGGFEREERKGTMRGPGPKY